MTNKQILMEHKATFNNSDRYKAIGLMDAARKDEAMKYYMHARLTEGESEKIRSYKATEVKFISGEIGTSVYCKNEKGKWVDITDYSTW